MEIIVMGVHGAHFCLESAAGQNSITQPTGCHMPADKRQHERFAALNLSYICEDKDGDILYEGMGRTLNVSEGGILLETNFFISPGNSLTLSVALEDTLVNMRGKVIHCHEGEEKAFHTGLEFQDMDQESRVLLHSFIKMFAGRQR
jgi:hypothetical protein